MSNLTDEDLCNTSVHPYYSSIGSQIRHVLDFYNCVLKIDSEKRVDLTARPRNTQIVEQYDYAKDYLNINFR